MYITQLKDTLNKIIITNKNCTCHLYRPNLKPFGCIICERMAIVEYAIALDICREEERHDKPPKLLAY